MPLFLPLEDGGAEGVRTPDLLNAIQALYQLSYDPIRGGDKSKTLRDFVKGNMNFCPLKFAPRTLACRSGTAPAEYNSADRGPARPG
jgi:hypothetical protein